MLIDLNWRKIDSEVWGEHGVSYELRPLDVDTFGMFYQYFPHARGADEAQEMTQQQVFDLMSHVAPIIGKYVRNIDNVTIINDKGERVPAMPEDVVKISAMLPLASEIIVKLVQISNLTDTDLGNSEKPPGNSLQASDSGNPAAD